MSVFPWTCPYCGRAVSVTSANYSTDTFSFHDNNKEDCTLKLFSKAITCPSPECREYALSATLYKTNNANGNPTEKLIEWQLRPQSSAKGFPAYIPAPILEDYQEACAIRDLSPKASATLSRRCLQGIIRDYWGITKSRLVDEISELKGKVDQSTWDAIDAVRSIGNIGAHMERDINLVIDVEPHEAQMLIGLIEILLKDWYIARYEREQHLAHIVSLAKVKAAAKIP